MVVQSGHTRHRTERLLTAKKDDFNRKNAANKRALGDLSGRLQDLDMKRVNEKVGPAFSPKEEGPSGPNSSLETSSFNENSSSVCPCAHGVLAPSAVRDHVICIEFR